MRSKIYLSDEGFGHIVRQRAVIEELKIQCPSLEIQVQTEVHQEAAKRFITGVEHIRKYNNITWYKLPNGSPDVDAINKNYKDYSVRASKFIEEEMMDVKADFIISDFVYEAFEVAARLNIPSFGVAHFTWDWFFSKLYPPPLERDLVYRFIEQAKTARHLYFPPFTPEEIVNFYGKKAIEVPLIMRKEIDHKVSEGEKRFKVLIIDSGSGVLADSIKRALQSVAEIDDVVFYVSEKFRGDWKNVVYIPQEDLIVDYVADMDLVIGRAGFNTISECIGLRTPMLLLGEAMNPEISENILMLKKSHLASFISLKTFEEELGQFLPAFIQHEYVFIRASIQNHEIETNGAEVIARDILNNL